MRDSLRVVRFSCAGVVYNVTISEESNTTRCVELFPRFTPEEKKHKKTIDRCERSYRYRTPPQSGHAPGGWGPTGAKA